MYYYYSYAIRFNEFYKLPLVNVCYISFYPVKNI